MRFDGRTVLVAGGTGALGRAIALAFLAEGATVVVVGRRRQAMRPSPPRPGGGRMRPGGAPSDATCATCSFMCIDKIALET